ncbi:MAG: glycosyltransferase family 2 protein [Microbacteriaceae bacterium]|nr:glycosyltransferase family 2 protein [Microbacteriaceae bacterium]
MVENDILAADRVPATWSDALAQASWLVVPLYNEGQVIREVMEDAKKTFPNIVCVDDGSRDNSFAEAQAAGVHVVKHPINLGQGAALRTGLDYALAQPGAKYFVTFDSDGQHRVVDAQRMIVKLVDEGLDIVVGSRFLDPRTKPGAVKKLILKLAIIFERIRTGIKLTDAHNGLRVLNRTAASKIQIVQNRMAHASEFTSEIKRQGLKYGEESVYIIYTDYSRAKGQSVWNLVNILSDLAFK